MWAYEPKSKRAPKGRPRRKAKQVEVVCGEVSCGKTLVATVDELQHRTAHYQHTAKGVVSLVESGIACLSPLPSVKIHDRDDYPHVLVQITPHSSAKIGMSALPHVGRGVAACSRPPHFLEQLEAACARDKAFTIAHQREIERKLQIQEELNMRQALRASQEDAAGWTSDCVPDLATLI
jgi:hypothetical protein